MCNIDQMSISLQEDYAAYLPAHMYMYIYNKMRFFLTTDDHVKNQFAYCLTGFPKLIGTKFF